MGRRSQADARQARKFERATRHTHSVQAGPSIVEMLEGRLYEVGEKYVRSLPGDDAEYSMGEWSEREKATAKHRGELRGLAISIAMMRHPLRRYEQVWWNYVKKLEKRAVAKARSSVDPE